MDRVKFTPWGKSGAPKPTGADCLELRSKKTDGGTLVTPKGAPPPSSKGEIKYPKQVGR